MTKRRIKLALLFLVLLAPVTAQNPNSPRFAAFKETTLSAAAEVITIQQPASGGKVVRIEAVEIWSDVAFVATFERDGTAATGTAITPSTVTYGTVTASAFHTSDVGVGTVITKKEIPANTITPIVFPGGLYLSPTSTAVNFTVRTASLTGDVKITIIWKEG